MDSSAEIYDADVAALAGLAREFGHHAGRRRFAGVAPDHAARRITVYRVPDPGWDSEISTLLDSDIDVVLADAPHTRDELLVARETVWAYADRLAITAISVPVDGRCLVVTSDRPEAEVQAELDLLVPGLATAAPDRSVLR
jgi:hypothetical protein